MTDATTNNILDDVDDLGDQLEHLDKEIQDIKDLKISLHKLQKRMEKHTNVDFVNHEKQTNKAYLDVIAVVSNPVEYKSRYRLYNDFCSRIKKEPCVRLHTIELQQRNKPFATNAKIKLRVSDELWHKENLINIATYHLPHDWEYMAWIDADVEFQRKDWAAETLRQLQHYDIVQLFSHAIDMGPNGESLRRHLGFCYLWHQKKINPDPKSDLYKEAGHPGYAFAIKREMYDNLGGLLEFPILGAADHHMCKAWIGRVEESYPSSIHQNYKTLCINYQTRCNNHLKQNIGYVSGILLHYWHGTKANRRYHERWDILVNNSYDPLFDVKKNSNNLWILEGNKPKLRDDLRNYFRARNEDGIDME